MFELSVGSKVFFLGEYQVLGGGSAFLAVLEPRFQLLVNPGTGNLTGIQHGSPGDLYFQREKEFFRDWDLEFRDPHHGRGGFGASTAQIALLQGFKEGLESFRTQAQLDFDLRKIHKIYLELATERTGVVPSGADLISQFQGGLVEVDLGAGKIQRHSWPFPQWQVLFFATGNKLATHEHLKELKDLELNDLRLLYHKAMSAFKDRQASAFAEALREYQAALMLQGWQSPATGSLLTSINALPGIVAAKGCGAMGADVIAVMVESSKMSEIISEIDTLGLRYIGNLENRTEGFAWKWNPQSSMQKPGQEVQWV